MQEVMLHLSKKDKHMHYYRPLQRLVESHSGNPNPDPGKLSVA